MKETKNTAVGRWLTASRLFVSVRVWLEGVARGRGSESGVSGAGRRRTGRSGGGDGFSGGRRK